MNSRASKFVAKDIDDAVSSLTSPGGNDKRFLEINDRFIKFDDRILKMSDYITGGELVESLLGSLGKFLDARMPVLNTDSEVTTKGDSGNSVLVSFQQGELELDLNWRNTALSRQTEINLNCVDYFRGLIVKEAPFLIEMR